MACPTVKLSSGYLMPMVGLGTYDDFKSDRTYDAVVTAIEAGYRQIDTAWLYLCEKSVGTAIKKKIDDGTVKREDLFVITKLWNSCHKRVNAAMQESLADLGLDYVDLYLMHFPTAFPESQPREAKFLPMMPEGTEHYEHDYLETWKDMEKLVDQGLARSIGVSNFNQNQLTRLLNCPGLRYKPVCNQIESSPYFSNQELVDFCKSVDVVPTAYCTLGRAGMDYTGQPTENVLEDPMICKLAANYNKTTAQVILRWFIQRGVPCIPKSFSPARINANIQIFDFELTAKDMAVMSALNKDCRMLTYAGWRKHAHYPYLDIKAQYGLAE